MARSSKIEVRWTGSYWKVIVPAWANIWGRSIDVYFYGHFEAMEYMRTRVKFSRQEVKNA